MVAYGVDREWTLGLRGLITQYGQLANAARGTEARRGQQFNVLVADLLRHWGIEDVESGVRGVAGRDEIDVTFRIGPTRYLLEAKWLAKPQSGDAVIKLGGRIRQRLRGARGIVLSMSGYTKHAADAAQVGQQPEVLLLDRSHFEAMLSGLLPPAELIERLVTSTTRQGGVHVPLAELVMPQRPGPPPTFTVLSDQSAPENLIRSTAGGVTARAVLAGNPGWPEPAGVGVHISRHTLLVTTADGIVQVDTRDGATSWTLPLPGCRGTPVIDLDGGLATLCNYSVVRWHMGSLDVIGGGFTGNSNLLHGPDGPSWVFDNTGEMYAGLVSLTSLGPRLGDQRHHEIEFGAGIWNATWLDRSRFFLAGDGHSGVVDLDVGTRVERTGWIESPQSGPRPLVTRDARSVLTAAYDQAVRGSVYQTSVTSRHNARLVHLSINGVSGMTVVGDAEAYLLADVRGNAVAPHPIVIRIAGLGPITSPQTRRGQAVPASQAPPTAS